MLTLLISISLLVFTRAADAASLAESFRGRAWGSAPREEDKTLCTVVVDDISASMVAYTCKEQVTQGLPNMAVVIYGYLDGGLASVSIYAEDKTGYLCTVLKDTAVAAWGPGAPQNKLLVRNTDPWRWVASADKGAPTHIAALSWNGVECSLLAIDNRSYRKYELLRKEEMKRRAENF